MEKRSRKLFDTRLDAITLTIQQLPLAAFKKDILRSDYLVNLRFMHEMACKNRVLNDISNIVVILLSAVVPVLINYSNTGTSLPSYLGWATILSVALAIGNALRQSYKFREKWQTYFRTTELLLIEGQNYFSLAANYSSYQSHELSFSTFIAAVGKMRVSQMDAYITNFTPESDSIIQQRVQEEVDTHLKAIKQRELDLARIKQINQNINDFVKNEPKISYNETSHDLKTITFFINDANYVAPEKMKFTNQGSEMDSYKILTQQSDTVIHNAFCPSTAIKNQGMPHLDYGSTGCLCLQAGAVVFITCYHVVKHHTQDWDLFIPGNFDQVISPDGLVGKIIQGERSDTLDIAVVKVSDEIAFDSMFPGQIVVNGETVFLDEVNYTQYQEVYIISRLRGSKKIKGKIHQVKSPVTINYGTKQAREDKTLDNIITIHSISTEPFSKTGDSGSLVFTQDGRPVGIVVAGDGVRCSFAIPFSTITDRFNLTLL